MVNVTFKRFQMLLCALSIDYGKKALNSFDLANDYKLRKEEKKNYYQCIDDFNKYSAFQDLCYLLYRCSTDDKLFTQYAKRFIL